MKQTMIAPATYIVFLRSVNVSGKNCIRMAALRNVLQEAGYTAVQTYIQSGNIILAGTLGPMETAEQIRQLIAAAFGFDVEVFVRTVDEVHAALEQNPFPKEYSPSKVFLTFLSQQPDTELVGILQAVDHDGELFAVRGNMLYYYLPEGMAKSRMNNYYFEKKLKVTATGRNLNTVSKLLQLSAIFDK